MSNKQPIIAVAPMMDWTDRHDRYFLRLIAPDIRLYTEMITAAALVRGKARYLLAFDPAEHPVALQLGGADPLQLAEAAKMGEAEGYDEINLNVGCPSDRVQSGRFGACLMLEPALVADCVASMQARVRLPVTVKCRIGVDHADSYDLLHQFIATVAQAGCQEFIIHARKAWLSGLSPKQNREIPPLSYETVYQIKRDFPSLSIILNGGLKTISAVSEQLPHVDGVMIGRAAYHQPYFLADLQRNFLKRRDILSRKEVIEQLFPYIHRQLQNKVKLTAITRHILGLFQGQRGAAAWRRYLSEQSHRRDAGLEVIENALTFVS